MDPVTLLLFFAFAVGVGYWANGWGRNGLGWGFAALIISPILAGIALIVVGKTLEAKARDIAQLNAKVNEMSNR